MGESVASYRAATSFTLRTPWRAASSALCSGVARVEQHVPRLPRRLHTGAQEESGTTAADLSALATKPLATLSSFVTLRTRAERELPAVSPTLAFDVSRHDSARTAVARSMLERMSNDVDAHAKVANSQPVPKMSALPDLALRAYFKKGEGDPRSCKLRAPPSRSCSRCCRTCERETPACSPACVPLLRTAANFVAEGAPASVAAARTATTAGWSAPGSAFAGTAPGPSCGRFCFGSLLSRGVEDLLRLNPYLGEERANTLIQLIACAMLRANRIAHASRAIGLAFTLRDLLDKSIALAECEETERVAAGSTSSRS